MMLTQNQLLTKVQQKKLVSFSHAFADMRRPHRALDKEGASVWRKYLKMEEWAPLPSLLVSFHVVHDNLLLEFFQS